MTDLNGPWVVEAPGTGVDIYRCHDCTAHRISWPDLLRHYEVNHHLSPRFAYVEGQTYAHGMAGVPQVLRCARGFHDLTPWRWVDQKNKGTTDNYGDNKIRHCKRTGCAYTAGKYETPPEVPAAVPGPHGIGPVSVFRHIDGTQWTRVKCTSLQCLYQAESSDDRDVLRRIRGHANAANARASASIDELLKQANAKQAP